MSKRHEIPDTQWYRDQRLGGMRYPALEPISYEIVSDAQWRPIFDTRMASSEHYYGWRETGTFDLSTREEFSIAEEDRNYPEFKGSRKSKNAIKKFNLRCEEHEKRFFSNACAQHEKDTAAKRCEIHKDIPMNAKDCGEVKCESVSTKAISDLLDRGYCWGVCAYNWAVGGCHNEIIMKMIDYGQHPDDGYDSDGWTPVMHLANGRGMKKNKETIKLLLYLGADPDHKGFRYCLSPGRSTEDSSFRSLRDHLGDYDEEFQEEMSECLEICAELDPRED